MHPSHTKTLLILSIILLAVPARAMDSQGQEPLSKKNKVAKTAGKKVSHCDMLLDAYNNKTKSRYYRKNTTIHNWEDDHGRDPLERAINRRDLQECINLVAQGHPLNRELYPEYSPSERLIHTAAKAGNYAFCKFLTRVGVSCNIPITMPYHTTPLFIATQIHHGKLIKLFLKNGATVVVDRTDISWKVFDQLAHSEDISLKDLQDLTKILAAQRAQIIETNTLIKSKMHRACPQEQAELNTLTTHINTADDQLMFDALTLQSTPQRFHELFPLCMQLGVDLETPMSDDRMPFARIAYQYDMEKLTLANYKHALCNLVTAYQAYLERKELQAIRTLLLIKNRPTSLLHRVPRDVFTSCILSRIVPFHTKQVNHCIAAQLALMQRLLTAPPKVVYSLSIAELPDDANPKVKEVLALFDPLNVEQHREQLTCTTRTLMGFVDQEPQNKTNT